MKRAAILALAVLTVAPVEAEAPDRFPRRWIYAAGGVAIALTATAVYASGDYSTQIGWCTTPKCVGISTATFAGLVGFLIGREMDVRYNLRYRAAPPMDLVGRARALHTRATGLELDNGLLAAFGDDGVELVSATPALEYRAHRGEGLRDVSAVGVGPTQLLVGSTTGLYLFGLSDDAGGRRAWRGELSAVAARGDRIAVASGGALRVGTIAGDSVMWPADSAPTGDRVMDLRWSGDSLLWVLTESALSAFQVRTDSAPVRLGMVELRGSLRQLAIADTLAVVSAGADGLYLVLVADPAAPRQTAHWKEPRYVYDVALWGGRVAVAAGPEGLYVLEPTMDGLRPLGLHRDAGFVGALAVSGDVLYTLDRTGGAVRRLEPPRFQDIVAPR